ncbi:hypothetical protein EV207_11523 [Scopulibacillus darangshiensis]|uniref:Uncharacterized protein n=1 Tax=Scopulibacillus darangshiensis TaxID=442528 RepID=A0A4R2P2K3_9BACL|nr:hypothetical protein [Scopulibacillus darangshiensis]TCP28797.1 hypothetical protein EV207_11523 [Scopulibacillus darangshiensis]
MAQNYVEYHIPEGSLHTFYVAEGKTVKIGQMVEVVEGAKVQVAGAGSKKVLGVVYAGTVGKDGLNVGYEGDKNEVATVVVLKPLVFLEAGGAINAGDMLEAGANGTVVAHSSTSTFVAGEYSQVVGIALESATSGKRFRVALG